MGRQRENCKRTKHPAWPAFAVLTLAVLLLSGILALAGYLSMELTVQVNGGDTMTLEYGETYREGGAMAFFGGEPIELDVEISGAVDTQALGSYTVTYTARLGRSVAVAERTVQVVDTQAPVITLEYEPDAFTEPGNAYIEEGFSAWDAVDGDLTDKVECTEADGVVTYRVSDASGNTTQVERTIVYDDRTAPELVLLGDETVRIDAGTQFQEPGYTATDNVDGDITVNVTVSGDYDIQIPGSYTIHYSVTDSHGNTAEADRGLVVDPTEPPETEPPETEPATTAVRETTPVYVDDSYLQGVGLVNDPENSTGKVIYLTFDDGPGSYTPELLAVLEKYNVKVTFFVVGSARLDYLDDIAAAGHSIGLHTNSHKYSQIYASDEAFWEDLNAVHDKVLEYTGIDTKLYRFPGGSSNTMSKKYCLNIMTRLVEAVQEAGYCYFDWNVDSNDAGGAKTSAEVYNNVVSGIKGRNTAVVLQHDVKSYSVNAVEKIIQWGLANGYTFLPLDMDSPTFHHGVNN